MSRTLAAARHLADDYTPALVVIGLAGIVKCAAAAHWPGTALMTLLVVMALIVSTSHARHPDPYLPDTEGADQ